MCKIFFFFFQKGKVSARWSKEAKDRLISSLTFLLLLHMQPVNVQQNTNTFQASFLTRAAPSVGCSNTSIFKMDLIPIFTRQERQFPVDALYNSPWLFQKQEDCCRCIHLNRQPFLMPLSPSASLAHLCHFLILMSWLLYIRYIKSYRMFPSRL